MHQRLLGYSEGEEGRGTTRREGKRGRVLCPGDVTQQHRGKSGSERSKGQQQLGVS